MNPTNVQESIRAKDGSARYLYLPAAVAAIGGLLFGFDTAVINGAIVFLKRQFALTDSQTEIGASSLLLGCVFGASLAAFTSDRFGRKKSLLAAAALFTVSSIGAALPRNITEFVLARLVGGLAIGLASTLSPLYIAEISPARIRGRLVSVNQLAIVSGILLSYSVNYGLTGAGSANWRWMFASAAVPSAFFLVTLLFVPESPRWLVQKGRETEADLILSRIKGRDAAQAEIQAIRAAVAEESGNVLDPAFRKPLVVAILIGLFSQFTGINTIIYYGSLVFLEHVPNQTASHGAVSQCHDRSHQLRSHNPRDVPDRSRWPQAIDDIRIRRHGRFLSWRGCVDSFPWPTLHSFALRPHLRRVLRDRHRHGNMGVDVRDLSEPDTRTRHVDRNLISLVRDPGRYSHVSIDGTRVDRARRIPALRRRLCCSGFICEACSSRDQGTQPGGN